VEFEWDPRKAIANLRKHGVDFADAGTVLHDTQAITIPDEGSDEGTGSSRSAWTRSAGFSWSSTRGARIVHD